MDCRSPLFAKESAEVSHSSATPRHLFLAGLLLFAAACGPAEEETPLFTLVPPEASGVTFVNHIVEREGLNVLEYEYFYNGGGVAVGDVNRDGRPDLFFTANMGPNRLYLNRGDWQFEDVTAAAGVAGPGGWTTGVTMADVNGDGRLDIYVCRSGDLPPDKRRNLLYISNGDGTFTEQAAAYGLDDPSYSTHAVFFDYDRDGDLDLYLLNHNIRRLRRFDVQVIKQMRHPMAGDKLYENRGGTFVDVSEAAGIIGNPIGFGLSATVSDINKDGWPDLYVANDYSEDDYLYINNGDGTFTESVRRYLTHTSASSMGADIADINNDTRPDIFTLDMRPADYERLKLLKGPDSYIEHQRQVRQGFYHQYMRNMLHLNTGVGHFSEIGRLAGVANTDWSWSALLADFDLDGYKDLFVTNGYLRDYTNLDFLEYFVKQRTAVNQDDEGTLDVMQMLERIPQTELTNYLFRNRGDPDANLGEALTFEDVTAQWGVDQPAFSNGAAYGDLDGDGDLDLVVNNINAPAFLYRNHAAERSGHHFLKVELKGEGGNRYGLGAKVTVRMPEGRTLYQEQMPTRGFQSSVQPVLVFGLGTADTVGVTVTWPDGARQSLTGVAADQTLTLRRQAATKRPPASIEASAPTPREMRFVALPGALGLDFVHHENDFVDFRRKPLLPHMLSRFGPALATADVNGDGLTDVFVGGARGQAAALYLQQPDGMFRRTPVPAFEAHARYEDVAALFFDADADADADLYVVSGGNDVTGDPSIYQDRLYLNGGFGAFAYAEEALPRVTSSAATVAAHDYDGDGDEDLFVGGRVLPGKYPYSPRSYLLENEGGRFRDVTPEVLRRPGLVTNAAWGDLTGDGTIELVLAGEWMPIRVFRYTGGTFAEITEEVGLGKTNGWWNCLRLADLDSDGDLDLVAGNRGLNAQMQAGREEPVAVHAADFDDDSAVEAVVSYYHRGRSYPMARRDEVLDQVGTLWRKYLTYTSYATATMTDIFSKEALADALVRKAYTFETTLFENQGGTFVGHPLPLRAQFAPVNGILVRDFDRDGTLDLLIAGNNFAMRTQLGRQDAGRGLFLRGTDSLRFRAVPPLRSGLVAGGDVRSLALVNTVNGSIVLVANNDAPLQAFAVK